jgi:hypothetical protein
MEFITLDDFLKMFSKPNQKNVTISEFIKTAQVRSGTKLRPLKDYMKDRDIKREDIETLFENIMNQDEYLTRFYNLSLKEKPNKEHMQLVVPMKSNHMNNNKEILFKNPIRNMHMEDILRNTKSGIENIPTFLDMLSDLYLRFIIDYKILTPSARFYTKNGRLGSVFSSYYFRASILNPYLVYSLNKSILHGTKIFTPTLGWSSYIYGFLECPEVIEYVGTDVIPSVCEKTRQFSKINYPTKQTRIFCKPSEDLLTSKTFLSKYREHFDVVFFSPPYYRLELYSGKNQSTERYTSYEEWLSKYWEATIQLCHHVLEPNGKLCYIISGYGSANTNSQYNLIQDMNHITKQYFKSISSQPMYNKNVHVTTHKEPSEQILLFEKK